LGGGVALLRAIKALEKLKVHNDDQRTGIDIVKKALSWPARQIAINAGEDGSIEAAQTKFCGLQVEPQEQVRFQKGLPAGHPRFSAVCGGCSFTVSVRKKDRSGAVWGLSSLASKNRFPAGGEGATRDSVRMRQRPACMQEFREELGYDGQLGTVDRIAELLYCWCAPQMEDAMCYERDYRIFEDRKKAEDTRVVQERRAGLIDRLLDDANKHGEKTKAEGTPVKDVAPAK
jgi:hypothetical protein